MSFSLVSGVMHGAIALLTMSTAAGLEEVKIFLKYSAMTLPISSSSNIGFPEVSSITEILFLALRPLVAAWKKPVFLSPRESQSCLLRYFHNSSSAL